MEQIDHDRGGLARKASVNYSIFIELSLTAGGLRLYDTLMFIEMSWCMSTPLCCSETHVPLAVTMGGCSSIGWREALAGAWRRWTERRATIAGLALLDERGRQEVGVFEAPRGLARRTLGNGRGTADG
jgi:hypothetical protein